MSEPISRQTAPGTRSMCNEKGRHSDRNISAYFKAESYGGIRGSLFGKEVGLCSLPTR
jgi:hypothetical protein